MRRAFLRLAGRFTVAASFAFAFALLPKDANAEAEVIKIGTLAPKSSLWGQVYRVWEEAVKKKSGGRLELQFFYNGTQGDEGSMVGKMKSGQLDAAALTAAGLSKIYKPILALQIPGLFRSWEKLDAARDAMKGEFEQGLKDAGFTLGGWGDVGVVHGMTKGVTIRAPEDLRGTKPATGRDDDIGPALYQLIRGVNPVPVSVPEMLGSLSSGAVNVVNAPALAAEQLQWTSKLDHISEEGVVFAIGGLVIRTARLDALPADLRQILSDTGKVAGAALSAKIRKEDAAAFTRLKTKMTVVSLTDKERERWAAVFRDLAVRLTQGTFPPDLVNKLVALSK